MDRPEELRALAHLSERLTQKFPQISPELIREMVTNAHRRFDGRPIRDFVPLLVEHDTVDELKAFVARLDVSPGSQINA